MVICNEISNEKDCDDEDCLCEKKCINRAYYGAEWKKPIKCHIHKKDLMKDVVRERLICKEEGCKTTPVYNIPNEKEGLYCLIHKKKDMIDVFSQRCMENNCNSISPSFNYPDKIGGRYCSIHKLDGMIDVRHKTCAFKNCNSISPNFNLPNESVGIYCGIHKLEGMIDVHHIKCIADNCNLWPYYNYKSQKNGIYCNIHQLDDMVDVVHNFCINNCGLMISGYFKYEGYCAACFARTFPDRPLSRNIKTKERAVVEFLLKMFPNHKWIFDKRVKGGSSFRRPDAFLDMGTYVIIVEIDENQHIYYDCSCTNRRLMELSIDINHRPMIVIRFNPDKYFDENNKSVPSCWKITKKTGLLEISNNNKWEERLNCLGEQITYWIENKTDKTVEPIELFYDQNLI